MQVNTDAAFFVDTGVTGASIIVREDQAQVLLSVCRPIRKCSTAEDAEAEACLEGVRLEAEWVSQPVLIGSDCSTLFLFTYSLKLGKRTGRVKGGIKLAPRLQVVSGQEAPE